MGKGSVSSKFLVILNIIYTILGAANIGLGIWFFVGLTSLTSLRNENHFITENSYFWVQYLPWIFIVSGIFVLFVSGCAFAGVMKKSQPLVLTTAAFQLLTVLMLIAATAFSIKFADTTDTESFVKVMLTDAFQFLQSANDPQADKAFQAMETRLQCCGSSGPTSYNEFKDRWQFEYPSSCCQTYAFDLKKSCPKTNAIANTRKGCIDVSIHHVRIAVKVFIAFGAFTAFIGLLNLICALLLTNGLGNRKKALKAKLGNSSDYESHQSHISSAEMETLKMPLKV